MTKEIDAVAEAMKEQISKMMQSFKLPDVDMTALVEGQRKNIDAMAKVAQLTTDRATAISQRQLEIFRVTSENLSEMFRDMKLTGAERGEIAKKAFDTAMTNARELAEIRGQRRLSGSRVQRRISLRSVSVRRWPPRLRRRAA
jgi:septum formation inhibitor MinC